MFKAITLPDGGSEHVNTRLVVRIRPAEKSETWGGKTDYKGPYAELVFSARSKITVRGDHIAIAREFSKEGR